MDQRDVFRASPEPLVDPRSSEFADQFGAFLQENRFLDELAVRRAQRAQRQSGERFDLVIMRLGLLQDGAMARALAAFCLLEPAGDLTIAQFVQQQEHIDAGYFRTSGILPISDDGTVLELAVSDPFSHEAINAIGYLTGRSIVLKVAAEGDIRRAFENHFGQSAAQKTPPVADPTLINEESSDEDIQRLEDMASEAPVIRLVQDLITRAVNDQGSDIHIEPREDCIRVRVRIDGMLHTIETLPLSMRAALGSRIKIMARLNIAERRLPQDGRIKVNVRGREIDLRVSTMPTLWGESIVLRILDRTSVELDFPQLGFNGQSLETLTGLLTQPNGIILVTGPTGSGKTTTLYTALSALNTNDRKIFTVEDPVEYQLAGVNQIQVQPKIGLTFATALRSILRQDPDIIMVGEIRDLETAQIAIQASLTGHLVLSTVHTNSAAATLTRLLDMGVEKFLLASTVKGVLAQRLVRRICPSCAVPSSGADRIIDLLGMSGADVDTLLKDISPKLLRGAGCSTCRKTGFLGRTTIHELLVTNPAVTEAILAGSPEAQIEAAGTEYGMITMLQDGLIKVLRGETTPEEVMRVTRFDACLDFDTKPTTNAET